MRNRTEEINVRVFKTEKNLIRRKARKCGMNMSEYLRTLGTDTVVREAPKEELIKHFVPPFRSEWVKRSERRAAGSGSPQRRKTVQTKRHPYRHKSLNECLAILFHNWAELYCG